MASNVYVLPVKRAANALAATSSNWRASPSSPKLANAQSSPPPSSPSETQCSWRRRESAPAALGLPASQPVLADGISREVSSLFTKLWREHRDSQAINGLPSDLQGKAKAIDDYKRDELGFRTWLVSQVNAPNWRELSYTDLQGLNLTKLCYYTKQVVSTRVTVPKEVLAHLKGLIAGRQAVHDKYYYNGVSTEEEVVGHLHHIQGMQQLYQQLANPLTPRKSFDQIRTTSWR